MPRDPRNYITVHNGMPEHPKVEPLSDAAFRLLMEWWCYCDRNNTDGKISGSVWQKRGTRKARTELVLAGLVEQTEDGLVMHDYSEHQRTAAEKVALSAKRSAAGRAGGQASARANAVQVVEQTDSKSAAELELEKEKNSSSELRPDVEAICEHLAKRIEENGSKRPNVTKAWRDSARLMLDKDGRTEGQAHRMIDWCQANEFWRSNILSMPTLREKYDQLRLKASETTAPTQQTSTRTIYRSPEPETVEPRSWA